MYCLLKPTSMNIILGASGQVGSAIVSNLLTRNIPVKGIVRDDKKASALIKKGAIAAIADANDLPALTQAIKDGETLFVLTPEGEKTDDILGYTKSLLDNYRGAIQNSPVKRVVGLSSMGAQYHKGTGNLLMSYMLEHAFNDSGVSRTFIRPAYYYSNWLFNLNDVKDTGVLPTFFPVDMKMPMVSPMDVAELAAGIVATDDGEEKIYELEGPAHYSSADVAAAFSDALNRDVEAMEIPRVKWPEALKSMGLSADGVDNFIEMTAAVAEGRVEAEKNGTVELLGQTTLQEYIDEAVSTTAR